MKMSLLAGLGIGYVLGARSGRERYDQIAGKARELWSDPRVQDRAAQVQRVARRKAGEAAASGAAAGPESGATPGWTGPESSEVVP